ncbi:PTS system mannose/fructose/N-acetylgalactosamine-transporter subunit IIB [[Eubacterium] hominis]|uniref:PTS system mannose/fructose/N-acetylgalactosamine-transporter subunit IIB n=1 Tax=[Eubacterium] hominis TaxID=2764325 RepID=UPI003A4DF085
MSIISARIDNRLLHGIVASQWTPTIAPQRVMVIDDHIANDPVLKSGMQMSKPPGTALSIINEETAYHNFSIHKYDGQKVFVITADPRIIRNLIEGGEPVHHLVVGGTTTPEEEDAVKVSNRAYVRACEKEVYRDISKSGTTIVVQYVPRDKEEPLSKFIDIES